MKKGKAKSFKNVWDAIADTPEQPANLRARAELVRQTTAIVKHNKWTQAKAAGQCGITQPRMNDLLRGRVSCFSLDALVNIATAIGGRVHVELELACNSDLKCVAVVEFNRAGHHNLSQYFPGELFNILRSAAMGNSLM